VIIATVIGARPQFIKAAAVTRAIEAFNRARTQGGREAIREILIHTGQHYDYAMDGVFFKELCLPEPHFRLEVGSGPHGKQTGLMLEGVEKILVREKPDRVLVYGDTNSTLAGALAASKLRIPVAHVEAGLRSYDRGMPEEINRVLTDHLSDLLFCPNAEAVSNLRKEGLRAGPGLGVMVVGDVMYDSMLHYSALAQERASTLRALGLMTSSSPLAAGKETALPYYLATLHRAENTDDPSRMEAILRTLDEVGRRHPVILPLHPRTRKKLGERGFSLEGGRVRVIEPVSYLDMILLEGRARAILTDSGGVQKEAWWLRVPCITLRSVTEWGYTLRGGWNIVAGWEREAILDAVERVEAKRPRLAGTLRTGEANAAERIVRHLAESLNSFV
jgi:UDP-GlcNAc3NAcA epimerase